MNPIDEMKKRVKLADDVLADLLIKAVSYRYLCLDLLRLCEAYREVGLRFCTGDVEAGLFDAKVRELFDGKSK